MHACLAAVLRNPYFQRRPGVEMPDLGGIDLVPARNLAGAEKKIDQCRDRPAPRIPRRIAKGLTEIAALRMRLQIEQADDFGGAPARDGINRHFISIRMASLKSSGVIASEEPGSTCKRRSDARRQAEDNLRQELNERFGLFRLAVL